MASYSDDFDRSDNPDNLGANWTTDSGELNISGNVAINVDSVGRGRYTGGSMDSANYYTQLSADKDLDNLYAGVRQNSGSGEGYFQTWNGTNSTHKLYKWYSGEIELDSWNDTDQAEPAVIKVQADGTSINGFIAGTLRNEATDSDITAAGAPGIVFSWEDATSTIDNWSAADLLSTETETAVLDALLQQADTKDVSLDAILYALAIAYAFGEESPTQEETPESWATWSDGAGGSPTIVGDADWGQVSLAPGEVAHSAVKDLGNTDSKPIVVTRDRYGTGSGGINTYIRGQATSFTQDAASPSWEAYSGQVSKTWRYVQIKIEYA